MKHSFKSIFSIALVVAMAGALSLPYAGSVYAGHNGAVVDVQTGVCGHTAVSATVADPNETHLVSNMFLVVYANGETQSARIPVDGSAAVINVGPFYGQNNVVINWNVFGGAERAYDNPLWNGYGESDFAAKINAYAAEQGGFNWVLDGPDKPNPFTNFNEVVVNGCAITKEMCMDNGWKELGFRNQGQCIRFVNTGKDSRI